MNYTFPFGSELQKVEQQDKFPKEVFVLGVYASAVHAKWIDCDGSTKVQALAVASEPYIFRRGDGAKEIIDEINIQSELGTLLPAESRFNGPSAIILDEMYLDPLGFTREQAWLCDIITKAGQSDHIWPDQIDHIEVTVSKRAFSLLKSG